MDKIVRMYLIWSERLDPHGTYRVRSFPHIGALEDFLLALDSTNVKSVKILSGILLEERESE